MPKRDKAGSISKTEPTISTQLSELEKEQIELDDRKHLLTAGLVLGNDSDNSKLAEIIVLDNGKFEVKLSRDFFTQKEFRRICDWFESTEAKL